MTSKITSLALFIFMICSAQMYAQECDFGTADFTYTDLGCNTLEFDFELSLPAGFTTSGNEFVTINGEVFTIIPDQSITYTFPSSGSFEVTVRYPVESESLDPFLFCFLSTTKTVVVSPFTVTCPADQTVVVDDMCSAVIEDYTNLITTNSCRPVTLQQLNPTTVSSVNLITIVVTDDLGNTTNCGIFVRLIDTSPPEITCPNDIIATNDPGQCSAVLTFEATVTDNCPVTITYSQNSGTAFPVGTTEVYVDVWDGFNNGHCDFTVTVNDTEAPVLQCKDVTIELTSNGTAVNNPFLTGAFISEIDNCATVGGIGVTGPNPAASCSQLGTYARTIFQDDPSGNTGTCTFNETVIDPLSFCCAPPLAVCNDITVYLDADGMASTTAAVIGAGSTADCGLQSETIDISDFDCSDVGDQTINYTITDINGESDNCMATITVADNEAPTASCADLTIQLNDLGNASVTAMDIGSQSSDNCELSSLSLNQTDFTCEEVGANTVTLTVTDASNNPSTCMAMVSVEDNVMPQAICQDVTVQLDEEGNGSTTADAVDNDSNDACGIAGLDLSQTDFTCAEVGANTVTLTVTDVNNNFSTCMANVEVEDNIDPEITFCPMPLTVECISDIPAADPAAVEGTDNCMLNPATLLSTEENEGIGCPNNPFVRTYTYQLSDVNGNTDECQQAITVINTEEPSISVVPELTFDCFESINLNPAWAAVTTGCENSIDYTVTVTGPHEEIDPNNCNGKTYTYTYTVTDACERIAFADQTITIENEGPNMVCPDNCEVFSCYEGDYEAIIEAWLNTVTATSSCSDELEVTNTYTGVEGICVGDFTEVRFFATDACNRTAECESGIFIIDTDAPEIIGEPTELLVPCTANTESIFAEWLANHGGIEAYDACSEDAISWETVPAYPMALLNCANGPQAITVEFIAFDGCGNSASATGVFSTKLLPNQVNVNGLIQTEAAEPVASVQVAAYQSSGVVIMEMSDESGDYALEALPYEENTEIVPSGSDDYLNGVTTYDLIILQQHILEITELDSPYKRIAADANRSGTISTLDLVLLRRLILHIDQTLADNASWRFVDADFVFPNTENPFETEFPETYQLNGAEEELKDFVAVKIGDLNLNAQTNNLNNNADDRSGLDELQFEIGDQKLMAGEEYIVEVSAQNFASIHGFQMTLDIDDSLISVLDIKRGALSDFSEANYNLAFANKGAVPMSWNHQTGHDLSSSDAAFRIIIKAKANVNLSEALSMSSSLTKAEAYGESGLMNVTLNFTNSGTVNMDNPAATMFELYQNQPNPFMDETMIGFVLPEAGEALLEIFDVSGKLVHAQRGNFEKGYNQINFNRANLTNGILYYQVSTREASASNKMIIVEE